MPSCMRAPPDVLMAMKGMRSSERGLGRAGDLLAHHRAHRATHVGEVHGADGDALAVDGTQAPDGRVADTGLGLLLGDPLRVGLEVDEAERVE